jgi:cytochrome c nitrite reductase small subunit
MSRSGLILCLFFGAGLGIGLFTFYYAEGFSYMSDDPKVCVNCHIMQPQYDSWQKSSHHTVAGCVDCHLPHDFIGKYVAKGENGWHHSVAFTLQNFHEPIQITPKNARILQDSCLSCHADLVHELAARTATTDPEAVQCVHCHQTVGHGERVGLGGPQTAEEKEHQ